MCVSMCVCVCVCMPCLCVSGLRVCLCVCCASVCCVPLPPAPLQGLGPGVAAGHGAVAFGRLSEPGPTVVLWAHTGPQPSEAQGQAGSDRLGLRERRSMERAAAAAPEPKDTVV